MKHRALRSKTVIAAGIGIAGLFLAAPKLHSQAAAPPRALAASGEFSRLEISTKVEGAKNPADFENEAYGKSFRVGAEGLPEGTYTVEIDVAETYFHSAGQRTMRIASGATVLVDKFDIFAVSGGFARAYTIRGTVTHAADSIGGPLTLSFEGLIENATFNVIRILDASGKVVAAVRAGDLVSQIDGAAAQIPTVMDPVIYTDPNKPRDARIDDLIRRMSLQEKVGQLMNNAPAISRLDVPAYNYWNEALHGVARAGNATVFPQAIGMAATWDPALIHRIGDAIATEARAKFEDAGKQDKHGLYRGLTFWAPNINIFRDPRWGRGQETYGEDPYLTSRTAVGFITGMQGDNPNYLKTVACAKHFAVHSGPEAGRASFNVAPAPRDLYETYLPQFQAAVEEAHVGSVMASYNAIDSVPDSANHWLLTELLRKKWKFTGHVVSDCGAVSHITDAHHYAASKMEGDAQAIRAGLDLECGQSFKSLAQAVAHGLLSEKEIDTALHRVLLARFQLGLFDPADRTPYAHMPMSEVESAAHLALARKTVRESVVLLKNEGVLPLDKNKLKKIAVIGMNADVPLNGNYNGTPSHPVTILQGIREAVGPSVSVEWKRGAPLAEKPTADGERTPDYLQSGADDLQQAVDLAKGADVVLYVGGLNAQLEGEESRVELPGFFHGDRTAIELPAAQTRLLRALQATGKPVVFVSCTGSAVAIPWEAAHLPAIIEAWYPGGEGGRGVADVLFGDTNPSGRLPITLYAKTEDLPAYTDYHMTNRTYRYFTGKPLFPFGHGLSYTSFQYGAPKSDSARLGVTGTLHFRVPVTNSGKRDGDEVVQVYLKHKDTTIPQPIRSLIAFQRVSIAKGATATVDFTISAERFHYWSMEKKAYVVAPGGYEIQIGASSSDIRKTLPVTVIAP